MVITFVFAILKFTNYSICDFSKLLLINLIVSSTDNNEGCPLIALSCKLGRRLQHVHFFIFIMKVLCFVYVKNFIMCLLNNINMPTLSPGLVCRSIFKL